MLLFLDESGTDHRDIPYEILAGVAVQEVKMWPLIQEIRSMEKRIFGMLLSEAEVEPKGTTFLKKRIFRFAGQSDTLIEEEARTPLVFSFLQKSLEEARGHHPRYTRNEYTAYGQAALDFVRNIFSACTSYNIKVFASIVSQNAPSTTDNILRKDYSYLFERFYYYLEDISESEMGLLVFDERDKDFCKRLRTQMEAYFSQTGRGQQRSTRIVPEPFFVHSDITTAVQIADLVAYSLNWGHRLNKMIQPIRPEMEEFGKLAADLQYNARRDRNIIYGIKYIDDLRPRSERITTA